MDLTTQYPRSVREPFAGIVMLGRTVDKAKAQAAGTIGEYNYSCPMDQGVFEFLGTTGDEFLEKVKSASSEAEIEDYARGLLTNKTQAQIDDFNAGFLARGPEPGSDGEKYFLGLRNQVAPDRTDVTTWPDLLDLDEKRQVPHRVAV